MGERFHCIIALIFIGILSVGCGRVHQTYLLPEKALNWEEMEGIDHVAVTTGTVKMKGASIEVELLDPRKSLSPDSRIIIDDEWDWKQWGQMLEAATADALYQTKVFSDVGAKGDAERIADPDYTMVVAITEWNPGNRWLRYFLGFGAGRCRMQIEAKFRLRKTGQIMFAFADAREHPGGPSNFPIGFKALKTEMLLKEDYAELLKSLQRILREETNTDVVPWSLTTTHPQYHPKMNLEALAKR